MLTVEPINMCPGMLASKLAFDLLATLRFAPFLVQVGETKNSARKTPGNKLKTRLRDLLA